MCFDIIVSTKEKMSGIYDRSELHGAVNYTLIARDHSTTLCLTQTKLCHTIDVLICGGQILDVEALLRCFTAAWLKRWGALPIDDQCVPLKRAFTHVINSTIEAVLRNGVLVMLTPKEIGALIHDIRAIPGCMERKCYSEAIDRLVSFLNSTAHVPRLHIDTFELYAHVLTRPHDFPTNVKIPPPAKGVVSTFVLAHLDPQLVALAEEKSPNALIEDLKELLPMYSGQLLPLYEIVGDFKKRSIRRYAYCTAIIHRANPWASRMKRVWPDIDPSGPRNPPSVEESHGSTGTVRARLPPREFLDHVSTIKDKAHLCTSAAEIMGHTSHALGATLTVSVRSGKRKRVAKELEHSWRD